MRLAVEQLQQEPDAIIVDGREAIECEPIQRAVIGGDALCPSVAAASIVAKVERDQMMDALAEHFPGYGFAQNKGYGTAEHREALCRLGHSSVHRLLFAPVRETLNH